MSKINIRESRIGCRFYKRLRKLVEMLVVNKFEIVVGRTCKVDVVGEIKKYKRACIQMSGIDGVNLFEKGNINANSVETVIGHPICKQFGNQSLKNHL